VPFLLINEIQPFVHVSFLPPKAFLCSHLDNPSLQQTSSLIISLFVLLKIWVRSIKRNQRGEIYFFLNIPDRLLLPLQKRSLTVRYIPTVIFNGAGCLTELIYIRTCRNTCRHKFKVLCSPDWYILFYSVADHNFSFSLK